MELGKMKMKKSRYEISINLICVATLIFITWYLALSWNSIPDKVPGHYNAQGVVDRWGGKGELLILPVISWIMYLGLTIIEQFPMIWNTGVKVTKDNELKVFSTLKNMLLTTKLLFVLNFAYLTLNSITGTDLWPWHLPVILILVFGTITYFLVKIFRLK